MKMDDLSAALNAAADKAVADVDPMSLPAILQFVSDMRTQDQVIAYYHYQNAGDISAAAVYSNGNINIQDMKAFRLFKYC